MSKTAIVCVDDEPVILDSLKIQLRDHFRSQFIYEFATDAEEAFEIIEELAEEEIDAVVVVSDWLMPRMKGDEFLLKLHDRLPNIVKIMLTGQADDSAVNRAQEHGALNVLIRKPWREGELIEAITSGLEEAGLLPGGKPKS